MKGLVYTSAFFLKHEMEKPRGRNEARLIQMGFILKRGFKGPIQWNHLTPCKFNEKRIHAYFAYIKTKSSDFKQIVDVAQRSFSLVPEELQKMCRIPWRMCKWRCILFHTSVWGCCLEQIGGNLVSL